MILGFKNRTQNGVVRRAGEEVEVLLDRGEKKLLPLGAQRNELSCFIYHASWRYAIQDLL
jgi:hypothetical protein